MALTHRVTALCSYPETTTVIPGRTRERMAMFRAMVALLVKITCSEPGAWNNSAASSRQVNSTSAAPMAAG